MDSQKPEDFEIDLGKPEDLEFAASPKQEHFKKPTSVRRGLLDMLVDPRTIQGLMMCGGGLLVLGLVVWLWSIGVFENARLVAGCLGLGNIALLGTGIGLVKGTKNQTAGQAMTLLACLVMPLNLWFYDAQGLITLSQGGNLWVPALICCAIYAGVARILADPKFVYAFVGGITMTGMLFLADSHVGRFWEIIAPASFLVILGIVCIHVERAFAPEEGPFSREKFGKAFFRAGHLVLASGLALLLGARLVGWFYDPFLMDFEFLSKPNIANQPKQMLVAFVLTMGATYSYIYSKMVVKARGQYTLSAVLTSLWSVVFLLDAMQVAFTIDLLFVVLGVVGVLANLAVPLSRQLAASEDPRKEWEDFLARFANSAPLFVKALNVLLVAIASALYLAARFVPEAHAFAYDFGWLYVLGTILAGLSCWFQANRTVAAGQPSLGLEGLGLMALFTVAAGVHCLGLPLSPGVMVLEMSVPLTLAMVSILFKNERMQVGWAGAAELTGFLVSVVVVAAQFGLISAIANSETIHHWMSLFFATGALTFALASVHARTSFSAKLAIFSICGMVWQILLLFEASQFQFFLAHNVVGLLCLTLPRLVTEERREVSNFFKFSRSAAYLCLTLSATATLLISFFGLLLDGAEWELLRIMVVQVISSGLVVLLSPASAWRRFFVLLTALQGVLLIAGFGSYLDLNFFQLVELLPTIAGLVMLGIGYYGWYQETDQRDPWVSFHLAFGSLLAAIPLSLGLMLQRFGDFEPSTTWAFIHEAGTLAIGLGLLASGVLCRIRWSTLVGSGTLALYVVSLVSLLRLPEQLQTTAVYMMVGGGLLFLATVLLSVYRDRLLTLRKRMKEGEGVFQVLKWR